MKYFLITLFFSLTLSCNKAEDVIFVIPEGYTGYVVIIYDQENGVPEKYENGKRVYEVPENGVLKTQFKANYGTSHYPEFYYGNIGNNEIPYKPDIKNVSTKDVNAFGGSVGKANKDLAGTEFVSFSLHYIGNEQEIRKAIRKAETLDISSL